MGYTSHRLVEGGGTKEIVKGCREERERQRKREMKKGGDRVEMMPLARKSSAQRMSTADQIPPPPPSWSKGSFGSTNSKHHSKQTK